MPGLKDTAENNFFWYRRLNDHTIYLRYLQCDRAKEFKVLAEKILAELRVMPAETRTLILDVRGNGGGNSMVIAPLQSGLRQLGFGQDRGRAAVLINRYTYSSAFDNALSFKKLLGARWYGETPSQNLAAYGEIKALVLPNSKLEVHLASRFFPSAAPELGEGRLKPDVPITLTFEDEQRGLDPVLESALNDGQRSPLN